MMELEAAEAVNLCRREIGEERRILGAAGSVAEDLITTSEIARLACVSPKSVHNKIYESRRSGEAPEPEVKGTGKQQHRFIYAVNGQRRSIQCSELTIEFPQVDTTIEASGTIEGELFGSGQITSDLK